MNLERYPYFAKNDYHDYSFYSEGPKGEIKKTVVYSKIHDDPVTYNLAFGDENPVTGNIDDKSITNNQDRNLVLATVANTINDFSDRYGNHYIYATGSTPPRTRLYQMGIASLWKELSTDFDVYGYKDGDWHQFQKNVNYEAFLVKRK
jgi:hypothetical protein